MKNKFDTFFLVGTFFFFILAIAFFSYSEYQNDRTALYRHIDEKLLAAAGGTSLILTPDFHDRTLKGSSITRIEDDLNIDRLSKFAKSLNIAYVYTMVQKNGKIYFASSSATEEERQSGKNLTRYFDTYDDASDELKKVFQTRQSVFAEYTDKWGTFRSVFIPMKSPHGNRYVVGADIRIDVINTLLQENAFFLLIRLIAVIALSLPFLTWRLRRSKNTLQKENVILIEDLKNEQQHLLNILWGTGAGTWEWNVQTGEIRINKAWAQMLGYTLEELSPMNYTNWGKLTHPEDLADVQNVLQRHFNGELDYFECEIRMRHKEGHWVWIHTRGRVIDMTMDGKPLWMAGVHLEITKRKEAERQLLKLSQAVEQSPASIIITDLEGNIEYANTAFFNINGYSRAEVIGKNPRLFKSDKTPLATYEEMWNHLLRGESWHGEFINRSKDGTEYIQSVNVSPIFQSDGKVCHYMAIEEDVTEKKRSEERIYHLANFDSLTGLPNRAQLENHFTYILSLAKRSNTSFAVIFLDLDRFKEINDSLGHKIGDIMLIESANRLKSLMREADIVARLGGDEFVIVLSSADIHGAEQVAQKVLEAISQPYHIEQYDLSISASIGIALYPLDGSTIETLSKNADTAMYRAKKEGRNCYRFFTEEMQTKSLRTLQLSNALRTALQNNELYLVYQPQISFQGERIIGTEALLRWNHPEMGNIPPVEFIPVAEENGLILPIGEWVLRTAVQQVRRWMDSAQPPMVMSVNLSAVQFRHHDLPDLVSRILREANVPPEFLELELTEGVAMHNPELAINVITDLNERGIRVSIDDFGTGYSSLSYLKQFKINKLKIDQSFVRDVNTDPDDKAIVSAVINMAHSLGLQTIAEGVETVEQLDYLREQGCDEVQGYYYSKPISADELQIFMESKKV